MLNEEFGESKCHFESFQNDICTLQQYCLLASNYILKTKIIPKLLLKSELFQSIFDLASSTANFQIKKFLY